MSVTGIQGSGTSLPERGGSVQGWAGTSGSKASRAMEGRKGGSGVGGSREGKYERQA